MTADTNAHETVYIDGHDTRCYVDWADDGDGSFTPGCYVCDYRGKPCARHAAAVAAARQHAGGDTHRLRLRRASV